MEKKLREYETEIKKLVKDGKMGPAEWEQHWRMVAAFQHERLVHLLVTLFFAGVTILFLGVSLVLSFMVPVWPYLVPLFVIDVILVVLVAAYVKHYYFLENHVQGLCSIDKKVKV